MNLHLERPGLQATTLKLRCVLFIYLAIKGPTPLIDPVLPWQPEYKYV